MSTTELAYKFRPCLCNREGRLTCSPSDECRTEGQEFVAGFHLGNVVRGRGGRGRGDGGRGRGDRGRGGGDAGRRRTQRELEPDRELLWYRVDISNRPAVN